MLIMPWSIGKLKELTCLNCSHPRLDFMTGYKSIVQLIKTTHLTMSLTGSFWIKPKIQSKPVNVSFRLRITLSSSNKSDVELRLRKSPS